MKTSLESEDIDVVVVGSGIAMAEGSSDAAFMLKLLNDHYQLGVYTHGAIAESVRHIVGVQFRNVATVGGSIWGRFGFSDVMTIFRALGAKVQLHKAGIMDLDEFAALPRTTRDVLVSVIVPKNAKGVVYLSQRNQSTDFPVQWQIETAGMWRSSEHHHIWQSLCGIRTAYSMV